MRIGDPIPSVGGATEWLNGSLSETEELTAGRPTLVYFWALSCGICKKNMPGLSELKEAYRPKGLVSVAVHMPRQESDTDTVKVAETLEEFEIGDPCAIDNRHQLKEAFQNEQGWVPVYYLFDADGRLKTRAAGEFGVSILKKALGRMLDSEKAGAAA